MNACSDCGGDAARGWTDGEAHERCVICEVGMTTTDFLAPEHVARLVLRAARLFNVDARAILAHTHQPTVAAARAAVYATLMRETSAPVSVIARLLNRDRKAVTDGSAAAVIRAHRDAEYARRLALLQQEARRHG